MEEILIGEKKYVSSKQAAKMTGYAKDYIGQLCREGRVPARLVGRSWYVLETAIQDHRFGDQKTEQEQEKEEKISIPTLSSTWEPPRYEAASAEILPSVNRLKKEDAPAPEEETGESEAFSQRLQDSWRAWFDRIEAGNAEPIVPAAPEKPQEESAEPITEEKDEEEVNVPIHAVYELPPKELLPARGSKTSSYRQDEIGEQKRSTGGILAAAQLIGVLFALLSVAAAVISTGYFDRYIISVRQASIVSGAILYNK